MIYKYFPYIICIFFHHLLLFVFCDNFENRRFLAWAFMFVLLCSFMKKKTGSVFPPFVTPLSNMFWSCAVMYPEGGTLLNVSRSGYIWF